MSPPLDILIGRVIVRIATPQLYRLERKPMGYG